ncbi:MerR family transcriptional regulator [Nocardia sp. NPDC005746]|uniref:MerR family transcriptional regulator n=1 Tax=Nocardia sp. NPDC005746 TaxID=3157062 RepID=UPI0033D995B4
MTHDTHERLIGIGELARRSGVPVRTIRFYCDEGVLAARRSTGGHRMFEPVSALERLLLVRRLRAVGVGLAAIIAVVDGRRSVEDAVLGERRVVEAELAALTWRQAALAAVADAPPGERARRLELVAVVRDRGRATDTVVRFWRRVLEPLTPEMFDAFVDMNVPEPIDPTSAELLAFAELVNAVGDPGLYQAVSRQLWRADQERITHRRALLDGVAWACAAAGPQVVANRPPGPGPELDQFVDVHARARGESDSPGFRRRLLSGAIDSDERVLRYWSLTAEVTGALTTGAAQQWLHGALERSVGGGPE